MELQISPTHTNTKLSTYKQNMIRPMKQSISKNEQKCTLSVFLAASTQSSMEFTTSRREISGHAGLQQWGELEFKHIQLLFHLIYTWLYQGGTICGAIEGSSKSLKTIDKRVFINFLRQICLVTNFRDKYAVFTNFRDKDAVFELHDKNTVFGFKFVCSG